ncbi:MAG TPA: TA system VapC family ribonuclease toxin [Vulgatibacter sp.]
MSFSIDANVLVYASNASSPNFERARRILVERSSDLGILYLSWPTLMAYLRIATHPGIFGAPLDPASALSNVQELLSRPWVRTLSEGEGFLDTYRSVTDGQVVRGNLVPDAHLAALLKQNGIRTVLTADADFRRFPFLDVRNPFLDVVNER